MQNQSDMNISTLLTSLYLRKAETVPPAAEVRQSLVSALLLASIAAGNGMMSLVRSSRSVCPNGPRMP